MDENYNAVLHQFKNFWNFNEVYKILNDILEKSKIIIKGHNGDFVDDN